MVAKENSKANPWIISYGRSEYDGSAIDTLTPIHKAQQIHKYRLGLRVVGIVAMVAAFVDIILIIIHMVNLSQGVQPDPVAPAITTLSMIFLISLIIDIILTANLNRYVNDKRPLILYIPCCILMLTFSISQLLAVIKMFGINIDLPDLFSNLWWANYITLIVCAIYLVAEAIRIAYHRHDLSLKDEIKKALH